MGMEVSLRMTLVHYDPIVVGACIAHAVGAAPELGLIGEAGTLGAAGTPLLAKGHALRVNLICGNDSPWRFYKCYLDGNPFEAPLGVERTLLQINWRCLPVAQSGFVLGRGYIQEPKSRGAKVWDRGVLDPII
jgi:hypothetical protein